MSYAIGLVGKPSVGKSTFFNAATMNDVPEGAYPFTTIDPSVGEAYVRVACAAPEFDETCTPSVGYCDEGTRFVPVQLVDVAGLIPGAHEGNGLGNQFPSDLNEAGVFRDCFLLPEGSTTADFAHHIHSDLGDGLLHGIDCRASRQVGRAHQLDDCDVIELVTTA
jgi:ribosome-binding ATPase YchF (GTP1/OBG family)